MPDKRFIFYKGARVSGSNEAVRTSGEPVEEHNAQVSRDHAGTETTDRSKVIGDGIAKLARMCLRVSIIILTIWLLGRALTPFWVIILPLLLGLILSTVLWPPAAWLRRRGFGPTLAAVCSLLFGILIVGGIISAIVPGVVEQVPDLAARSTEGMNRVQKSLQGPPFNIPSSQIDHAVESINEKIRSSSDAIVSGVFTGVSTVSSVLVTLLLSVILAFFFVKDGDRFVPWVRQITGEEVGGHITEVAARAWDTLSGFIRTQAFVSLIDSIFIGAGLLFLSVPLALPLSVLTFLGGFVPILGAFVAGALAVLVALVTQGPTTALIVLGIVIAVQQIEGNVLQPMLQSRSMSLHPVLVLLGITAGSTLYGVVGGFLAVPVVATLAVLFRYLAEQIDLRAGTVTSRDLVYRTDRGLHAAQRVESLRALAQKAAAGLDLGHRDAPSGSSAASTTDAKSGLGSRLRKVSANFGKRSRSSEDDSAE